MLCCEQIATRRGGRLLYQEVSFTLLPGACLILQGANGCGKTTLLRTLAGLLPPESGSIRWNDHDVQGEPLYRQVFQYLGHRNAIKPELTVIENLLFWAELHETEMLIPAALSYLELDAIADTPCRLLSAGWQRRVAIARLLATPADLWLLDEPAVNLDAHGNAILEALIRSRCKQGGIVIMSSHQPPALEFANTLQLEDFRPC